MSAQMTKDEWHEFLMTGTRTGKAAVTKADGTPHVTPVWLAMDGDDVLFTTHDSGLKSKALKRDPRISICVDDQTPPYSFVSLWGEATLSEDLAELVKWATVIGGRYMGADHAEEYGRRNGVPGEHLVRVHVTKAVAIREVAD